MESRKDSIIFKMVFLTVFSLVSLVVVVVSGTVNSDGSFDATELITSLPTNKFYINGTWTDPIETSYSESETKIDRFLDVVDPSTATVVATLAIAGPRDIDAAVKAAKEAWFGWSYHTSPEERQSLVENLIRVYRSKVEEMAQLVSTEMGSPIDASRGSHAWGGLGNIESALEMMEDFEFERSLPNIYTEGGQEKRTTILFEPIGVVGMITPWNWPLNQITLKVIPALLVGCTCVLKPSEESPLSALLFAELMHDAGFPPGVFNMVNGDGPYTGDALTKHPDLDMISFTGSTHAGRQVAANAALAPIKTALELGGKGANLLFADVGDEWMEEAVTSGVESVFYNSGQTCNAPTRMLVQEPYYDKAVHLAKKVAQNSPVDSAHVGGDDHIGPVVSLRQFERIQKYIQIGIDEGASLVAGGLGRPENLKDTKGYYVRPTVFADCTSNMTIMQEEIFGPVVCLVRFGSEAEALEIANDTPYGLTNYVQTRSLGRRRRLGRLLRSGMVEMNDAYGDPGSPFGGVKGSGYGREGGIFGLEEFCTIKAVTGFDEGEYDSEDDEDYSELLDSSASAREAEL
jgi:aldehyde dehydrogenase (NAD+)